MGGAPKPDANVGIAALKSAETGQQMLDWMRSQAEITNRWAEEDRTRYTEKFLPLQDKFITEAQGYDTPGRRAARAAEAAGDVSIAASAATGQRMRQAMAMGVNPASGAFQNATAKAATDTALATAGARNLARRSVEGEGRAMRAEAINLGQGLGVNPATSIGISNGAMSSGFGGAMQGYGQQGSLLNADFQNRMSSYQANQGALGAVGGALGRLWGAGVFASSEKIKHDKSDVPDSSALGAVRKMPVKKWTYDEGHGDGGTHVGPYAEDFAAATGEGDGSGIDAITLMGVTLGAVRELDKKVANLERKRAA